MKILGVRKSVRLFAYSFIGIGLLLIASPFILNTFKKSSLYRQHLTEIEFKEFLESINRPSPKGSAPPIDQVFLRALTEDPVTLAQEMAKTGDYALFAVNGGMSSDASPIGVTCQNEEKMRVDERGCVRLPAHDEVDKRLKTYNITLIHTPGYLGSCKEEQQ